MRSEIKEYNHDWLMAGTLKAAFNLSRATPKEYINTLKYIPYFKGVAESFVASGETEQEILRLLSVYYENILSAKKQGKKLALTPFCFSPVILYALDIVPIAAELLTAVGCLVWKRAMTDYTNFAVKAGLPDTICSSHRGALGAFMADLCEEIDFIITNATGTCDSNSIAFSYTATLLDKPFFQLNQPSYIGDEYSEQYHFDDFKALIPFLEAQTGRKMDWDRLAQILEEVNKQDRLVEDLEDMQLMTPCPFSPLYTLGIYVGQFTFAGHRTYTALLEKMVEETKTRTAAGVSGLKSGNEKLRALVCYTDHYTLNTEFWNWLDDRGIAHVGIMGKSFRDTQINSAAFGNRVYGIDTTSEDAMIFSAAQLSARVVMLREMRGPFDAPNMWLEECLIMARMFKADFFLFNSTAGCANTWGAVKLLAREVEKQGYPIHIMSGDAWDDRVESWELTRDRLDEFLKVRGFM